MLTHKFPDSTYSTSAIAGFVRTRNICCMFAVCFYIPVSGLMWGANHGHGCGVRQEYDRQNQVRAQETQETNRPQPGMVRRGLVRGKAGRCWAGNFASSIFLHISIIFQPSLCLWSRCSTTQYRHASCCTTQELRQRLAGIQKVVPALGSLHG